VRQRSSRQCLRIPACGMRIASRCWTRDVARDCAAPLQRCPLPWTHLTNPSSERGRTDHDTAEE
jgi:hypothetical protein